ncbi:MAG: ferrous iron transport protein B [Clostridia bacterium]|nr:ferrous iron transport protein B [Clostridia bacterium]
MKTFALAGNPNCGKTTLFNAITGSTAHVGNWPGVTVDKREGVYKSGSEKINIVDLPGIYSLSPYTPEELIARNYILSGEADGVIDIVDATNLERNLYLTTQLLELDVPVVVALNMMDEVEANGDVIDARALESALGCPVVPVSALKKTGLKELMKRCAETEPRKGTTFIADALGDTLQKAQDYYEKEGASSALFHAIKLLESDTEELSSPGAKKFYDELGITEDMEADVADERYRYISANFSTAKVKKETRELTKSDRIDKVLTHRVWSIPIFIVILFLIFHLTFSENLFFLNGFTEAQGWMPGLDELGIENEGLLEFIGWFYDAGVHSPGVILANIVEWICGHFTDGIAYLIEIGNGAGWVSSLVCDGVLSGIFAVIGFLPQILFLFLGFSILEDTGYMARVAFVLDRIFRRFGVTGRAFMPMIMGFGCGLPAMVNTRTLSDEKERTATIRVIPFFSCGAKLPILTGMAGAILEVFGVGNVDWITFAMYLTGVIVAIVAILLMRNTTMRGAVPPFIMELPTYRMPGFKNLMLHLWDKCKHFVKKAFTIIFISTVIIWFLQSFSWKWEFLLQDPQDLIAGEGLTAAQAAEVAENPDYFIDMFMEDGELIVDSMVNLRTDESILGSIGMLLQPIFTPLGFGSQLNSMGWVFAVAAITGLVAKENVIATFGALAAVVASQYVDWEANEVAASVAMVEGSGITVSGVLAFIVFNMTTIPCFASVATARAELPKGKLKWTVLFWFVTSYVAASMFYTCGMAFEAGGAWWSAPACWIVVIAVTVLMIVLNNKGKLERFKFRKKRKEAEATEVASSADTGV